MNNRLFKPGFFIIGSFLGLIGIGTLLLSIPGAQIKPLPFFELVFGVIQITSGTGLETISIDHFTHLGKILILMLMQISGLGLLTIIYCALLLFTKTSISDRKLLGQLFDIEIWGKAKTFLFKIISITFFFEIIGASIISTILYLKNFTPSAALLTGLFYSISAFCNIGIIPSDNALDIILKTPLLMITIVLLTWTGSTGFFVWDNVANFFKKTNDQKQLTLTSRVVFHYSLSILFFSAIVITSIPMIQTLPWQEKLLHIFFNSFGLRCAGFSSINHTLTPPGPLMLLAGCMLIGNGPLSTGSGIKVTTVAILFEAIRSNLQGKELIFLKDRTLTHTQTYKALSITLVSLLWIFLTTFILIVQEPNSLPHQLLFQTISSFSNCGLSIGMINNLTILSKIILGINMIVGRIGLYTIITSLFFQQENQQYQFPHEIIMIG